MLPEELSRRAYIILRTVRHVFDLDANPSVIEKALAQDSLLKPLIKTSPGLRLPGCWDSFEMLLRVIAGQQVSVAAATTVMRRIADSIGLTPEQIAASSPTAIATLGMPLKRATTMWQVGSRVQAGTLSFDEHDPQVFYDQLVALPGIGPWSAEYLQMRVLHWPDVLPAGDLGLQKAVVPGQKQTEQQLRIRAEAWRPWRSYATMLLWKSLAGRYIAAHR
jgi:AraC family transcriptional regulator of adaptative response / DNA-3-methyladenine glycosylase II